MKRMRESKCWPLFLCETMNLCGRTLWIAIEKLWLLKLKTVLSEQSHTFLQIGCVCAGTIIWTMNFFWLWQVNNPSSCSSCDTEVMNLVWRLQLLPTSPTKTDLAHYKSNITSAAQHQTFWIHLASKILWGMEFGRAALVSNCSMKQIPNLLLFIHKYSVKRMSFLSWPI